MERSLKISICVTLYICFTSFLAYGEKIIIFPDDTPTIEALISAHKQMKKYEDLALAEVGVIDTEQSLTKKVTKAYNETRTVLNKRLGDAMGYIQIATRIVNLGVKLEYLIDNYKDFTTNTYQHALKKPYVMIYWTRANIKLEKEVKHLVTLVTTYAATGASLLKSTMEEKNRMLATIEMSIAAMNMIIDHNDLVCRTLIRNGLKIYHVWDILGTVTEELATEKLISRWCKEQE